MEEIKSNLKRIFANDIGKDAQFKAEILNQIFGKSSWAGLESLHSEALKDGLFICKVIVDLCISKEPTNRLELIAYVNRAKEEFRNEWATADQIPPVVGTPYQDTKPGGIEVLLQESLKLREAEKKAVEAHRNGVGHGA